MGNRTRDLPACSAVPQPTASPRASYQTCTVPVDKVMYYYINSHKHKFKPWRWKLIFCRKGNVTDRNRIDANYRPWWIDIPASFSEGSSLNPGTEANYLISGLQLSSLLQGIFLRQYFKTGPSNAYPISLNPQPAHILTIEATLPTKATGIKKWPYHDSGG